VVEIKLGRRTVDLPFTLRIHEVTEDRFDELTDPDMRAELIDGVMIVHSPATPQHDGIAGFLRAIMLFYADTRSAGAVFGPDALFHPSEGRRFGPDIFFIRQERMPHPLPEKQFELVPDLIIEVLSPSNRAEDLEVKRPAYREEKVPEIWFIDPMEQHVIQDTRRKRGYGTTTITTGRVVSTVLAGFWIEIDWLWADPFPSVVRCLQQILQ
jgi:Uma2 family endonuclease